MALIDSTGAGIAQGPRIRMAYAGETVRGTPNANPDMYQLRCITRDIDFETKSLGSAEIYPDRQRRDWRQGSLSVAAQLNYELSVAQAADAALTGIAIDDMLSSCLGADWGAVGAIPSTAGTLLVGTDLNTFTMERQFLDVGLYEAFAGCVVNDMTIDFKPESIIGGQLTIVGMGMVGETTSSVSVMGSGSLIAPSTAPPLDVFHGLIKEGGDTIGIATMASINIKNGRTLSPVIGSRISPDIFDGTCIITGSLSAMFKDSTLRDKFLNETVSSLVIQAVELGGAPDTGRRMVFTLPAMKYAKNDKKPKAEGPVIQDCPFECLYDPESGTTIQIDRYL